MLVQKTHSYGSYHVLAVRVALYPHADTLLVLQVSNWKFKLMLPPFEDNGLPFWVPGGLHQHSEVALWYLLSIQMIYQ